MPLDEEDVEDVEDWIIECVDDEDKIEEVAEEICNKPADEDHIEDVFEEVVEEILTCDEVCRTATVCGDFDENDLPEDACLSCSAPDIDGNFVCTLTNDESTEDDASFDEEASEMLMDAMHENHMFAQQAMLPVLEPASAVRQAAPRVEPATATKLAQLFDGRHGSPSFVANQLSAALY